MIANSGHNEKGTYTGGKPGDQTGEEWEIRTWYNRPWNVVLRYPNIAVASFTARLAVQAANNPNCGYGQDKRTSFHDELEEAGWYPQDIDIPCQSDCSSGITALEIATGHILNIPALAALSPDIYTGNMRKAFVKAGFEELTDSKYLTSDKHLMPGDVLLYEGHHVAMNLDYGSKVQPEVKPEAHYYENLGWNEDAEGWWYAWGHNKGQYHVNNVVRIVYEGKEKLWGFDTEGYLCDMSRCEMNPDGSIKYIHGNRIKTLNKS